MGDLICVFLNSLILGNTSKFRNLGESFDAMMEIPKAVDRVRHKV